MIISFVGRPSLKKTLAAQAAICALFFGAALGAEPEAKPKYAIKPPVGIAIAVDHEKFVEGWKQTIPIEGGDTYDVSIKDGWLIVKRSDNDGGLDWQLVLARVVAGELPKISRIGAGHFELSYLDGRFFIRETADFLRVMREPKTDLGFFEHVAVLGEGAESKGSGRFSRTEGSGRFKRTECSTMSSWQKDDWFYVGVGPDEQIYNVFVRLNAVANRSHGHGVMTTISGFLYEFHGETWLMDDGDLLVCRRTLKSAHEAQLARKKIEQNLPGSAPPDIDATSWLNTPDGLPWDKLRGKVVLLDFWGTWCGPCVKKIPEVEKLAKKYAGRDLVVIGIHSEQGSETCEEFVAKNGITFPIAIDSGKTAERFAVDSWPSMFLIDKAGKVVSGYSTDLPADDVIAGLLEK
jgi:thiol-disulfide isomerase/thioredoxin